MWKFLTAVTIIAAILGYGYWHSAVHAYFYVALSVSGEKYNKDKTLPNAEVHFLDSNGVIIASGVSDTSYRYIHLTHPESGNCSEYERSASLSKEARNVWKECFNSIAIWIPKWIENVRQVEVKHGDCVLQNIPITISKSNSDWYLWWVPHPHIGGIPYTYYSAEINISAEECHEKNT